jgi:hypothetical protein
VTSVVRVILLDLNGKIEFCILCVVFSFLLSISHFGSEPLLVFFGLSQVHCSVVWSGSCMFPVSSLVHFCFPGLKLLVRV